MLGLSSNPIPSRPPCNFSAAIRADLRLPLCRLSPAEETKLRATLVKYGLLTK